MTHDVPVPAHHRERCASRGVVITLIIVQIAILGTALLVPLSVSWSRQEARRLGVQAVVAPGNSIGALERHSRRPAFLVLGYHNIETDSQSLYSITPKQFVDQMHMLVDAGYTAASAEDIESALARRAITGRKVLITFDDGARGIWTYADPVLERYKLRAMAFIITGQVGKHQPYYVTWPQLRAMQRSGRWDLQSHTNLGHREIRISPTGVHGFFLANLEWLPAAGRLESTDEYYRRVNADLIASRRAFLKQGLPEPRFFAYPFSAAGTPSNDPRVPGLLRGIVAREFGAAFHNDPSAVAVSVSDLGKRQLPRISVRRDLSARALYERLQRASPRGVDEARLGVLSHWCCLATGAPNVSVDRHGRFQLLGRPTGWRMSTYGPGKDAGWSGYNFRARAHGLRGQGTAAAVVVRVEGLIALRVTVARASVRIQVMRKIGGASLILRRTLPSRNSHAISVIVTGRGTKIVVDGTVLCQLPPSIGPPTGSVGLGLFRASASSSLWFDSVQIKPT